MQTKDTRLVLIVRDFMASLRFYYEQLGLIPELNEAPSPEDSWVCFSAGSFRLCLCRYSEEMPYTPDELRGTPDMLLFEVDDLEAERARLISLGVTVSEPFSPGDDVRICEFFDPDGRHIGLEEKL